MAKTVNTEMEKLTNTVERILQNQRDTNTMFVDRIKELQDAVLSLYDSSKMLMDMIVNVQNHAYAARDEFRQLFPELELMDEWTGMEDEERFDAMRDILDGASLESVTGMDFGDKDLEYIKWRRWSSHYKKLADAYEKRDSGDEFSEKLAHECRDKQRYYEAKIDVYDSEMFGPYTEDSTVENGVKALSNA